MPLVFASTNKVYGCLDDLALERGNSGYFPEDPELAEQGLSERLPLQFATPYGCSKGAADQYVLDYARSFGLRAAVMRMSCIYGQRQMGTEDQGWVAHFLIRAIEGRPITIYGNGRQVRDVCDVADTCDAYLALLDRIDTVSGRAFNWGGGPNNSVSLLTVIEEIGRLIGREPFEFDLAAEDGVLAEVLHDVPRELVLHGSVIGRLVGGTGQEALHVARVGVGKANHHSRGRSQGQGRGEPFAGSGLLRARA